MNSTSGISIVIPIHNCDKFLRGCLQSVAEQTFTDFEVLMVNNRSTDSSEDIANEFQAEDKRFRLLQCRSGFAGSARNVGIKAATGKYIAFIDGDDKVSPDYLQKLHSAAEKHDADIVVCGYNIYYLNKNKRKKCGNLPQEKVYDNFSAIKELLRDKYMRFYLWNKLWKRSLFTEHSIEIPDMYYEDAAVCPLLYSHAEKVVLIGDYLYEYMRYNSSVVEINMCPDRINDYINTIPMIRQCLEDIGYYRQLKSTFQIHFLHVYLSVPLLCMQIRADLKDNVLKNALRGMKKARQCYTMPTDDLKKYKIGKDTVR